MAPFYEQLCEDLGWVVDKPLLDHMKQANEAKLKELDEQIADAEKNQGEMEVRDSMLKKAEYYSSIGDKVNEHCFWKFYLWGRPTRRSSQIFGDAEALPFWMGALSHDKMFSSVTFNLETVLGAG